MLCSFTCTVLHLDILILNIRWSFDTAACLKLNALALRLFWDYYKGVTVKTLTPPP